jgi:transmembrane sensor
MEKIFLLVEDVIADESFQCWYFKTDKVLIANWEAWVMAHPGQAALVKEAVEYMDRLVIQEKALPAGQLAAAEQRLHQTLAAIQETPVVAIKRQKVVAVKRRMNWWWAAAAIFILSVTSIALWRTTDPSASVQTAYGEITEKRLPDGSKVMLNANSEITYGKDWEKGAQREVWLKGEAFFHVAKTPSRSRFVVHTDQFDIIVTGTQFNVVNRHNTTSVMLTEGSVTLHGRDGKDIYMQPGDFVTFNNHQPEKKAVHEENILAWREKKLVFENTLLLDAVQVIEDHYGVTIRLDDETIGNKPITGILPNDNLDVLLQALEATSEFRVVRNNNEILITNQ